LSIKENSIYPDYYTKDDLILVKHILSNATTDSLTYNGEFIANWLLSDFEDSIWITSNKGREKLQGSKWKYSLNIDWHISLPNGLKLTDPRYKKLLETIKKSVFIIRSGHTGKVYGVSRWKHIVEDILLLTRWLVLHEKYYKPHKYYFNLLEQRGLDSLFTCIATGGWFSALEIPQRIVSNIHKSSPSSVPAIYFSNSNYSLSDDDAKIITDWLYENDYYISCTAGAYSGSKYLSRNKIADLIGEDVNVLIGNSRAAAFLRQLETDYLGTQLLLPVFQRNEFPSHNTPLINDALNSAITRKALECTADSIKVFLSTYRHLNNEIPDPLNLSPRLSYNKYHHLTKDDSRTPFIPVNTGLKYLNVAMEWINCYGDTIIDCFIQMLDNINFEEYKLLDSYKKRIFRNMSWRTIEFNNLLFPTGKHPNLASLLNTSYYCRWRTKYDYDKIRSRPTLEEAIDILVGSCIACIGLMKPSRNDEIHRLPLNCLIENNDGYYLRFSVGKSNVGECFQATEKPIPYITAKAIKLLQKLSSNCYSIYGYPHLDQGMLFNLPSTSLSKIKSIYPEMLSPYLNKFCDYANLPVDSYGRRWYIRIHEMRKWFLLLLFWAGRYDVLDAARWIAGHTDATHLYAYIEREFPGEELPQLEAQYAVERLRDLELTGTSSNDAIGIDELYERVLEHFKATSLSMIPNSDWESYVALLRKEDSFRLEPHSIHGENEHGIAGINVSFVLREKING